jgi:hypothetical protein
MDVHQKRGRIGVMGSFEARQLLIYPPLVEDDGHRQLIFSAVATLNSDTLTHREVIDHSARFAIDHCGWRITASGSATGW